MITTMFSQLICADLFLYCRSDCSCSNPFAPITLAFRLPSPSLAWLCGYAFSLTSPPLFCPRRITTKMLSLCVLPLPATELCTVRGVFAPWYPTLRVARFLPSIRSPILFQRYHLHLTILLLIFKWSSQHLGFSLLP